MNSICWWGWSFCCLCLGYMDYEENENRGELWSDLEVLPQNGTFGPTRIWDVAWLHWWGRATIDRLAIIVCLHRQVTGVFILKTNLSDPKVVGCTKIYFSYMHKNGTLRCYPCYEMKCYATDHKNGNYQKDEFLRNNILLTSKHLVLLRHQFQPISNPYHGER